MSAWADVDPNSAQSWDAAKADEMLGLMVLVGLRRVSPAGEETGMEQFFGHVVSADPEAGVVLQLAGLRDGEQITLPPIMSAFEPAGEGIYRLKSTGEEVADPDFLATFEVHARAEG